MGTGESVVLDISIPNLAVWQQEQLQGIVEGQFEKVGKYKLLILEELHYDMTAKNIKAHELEKLHTHLGVTYYLKLELKDYQSSDGFDMLEPDKVNSLYPSPRLPQNSSSIVTMRLMEAKSATEVFRLDLVTNTQELSHTGNDGSVYFFDAGSVYGTIKAGTKRGVKYMLADCICPKASYVKRSKIMQWL